MSEVASLDAAFGPARRTSRELRDGYPPHLRLAFARLLTGDSGDPVVWLVLPENRAVPGVLWNAVPEGSAYAVRTVDRRTKRSRALAFDFDAKLADRGTALEEATSLYSMLRRSGVPAVLCESGPASGFHVHVGMAGEGLSTKDRAALKDGLRNVGYLTLDCSTLAGAGVVRPPGAPHRAGGVSRVMGDAATALKDLGAGAYPADINVFRRMLPRAPRATLRTEGGATPEQWLEGFAERDYPTGSEASASLAMQFINRGMAVEGFIAAAMGPKAHPKLAATLERRGDDALEWLRGDFERLLEKAAKETWPKGDDRRTAWLDNRDVLASWITRLGAADLSPNSGAVAEVILRLALQNGTTVVGISGRDLGLRAGLPTTTARRHLARLVECDMLENKTDVKTGSAADRYALVRADRWGVALSGAVGSSLSLGGVGSLTAPFRAEPGTARALALDLSAEVWMAKGLGHPGRLVYLALAQMPSATTAQLADRCLKRAQQIGRVLARLEEAGLARRLGRWHWAAEYNPPADAADRLGVLGEGARRKRQIQVERRDDALRLLGVRIETKVANGQLMPVSPLTLASDAGTTPQRLAAA